MNTFKPENYGSACAQLIDMQPPVELGPGKPHRPAKPLLEELTWETLFPQSTVQDPDMAQCCLSGLWLLHNFLDPSHQISQQVHTASGSYWHGIMHRREPDFSNAKYWFRRVGEHPIFGPLGDAARRLAKQYPTDPSAAYLAEQSSWDPLRFADLCEAVSRRRSTSDDLCRAVAGEEWRLLFDHCYRQAIGE